jgi:hypothetical protein
MSTALGAVFRAAETEAVPVVSAAAAACVRSKTAPRTVDALWATIGRLIDRFTLADCANYFAAAGYDAP